MLTAGAILKEPTDQTLRFVKWHLEQGVDRMVLCFDDPFDPAMEVLNSFEQVTCIPCTPAFWKHIGVNPDVRFTLRQNAAMQFIYDGSPRGWFLNLDGDELVYLETRTLKEEVLRQPAHVKAVLIRPAEYIQSPASRDTLHFRTEMPPWCCRGVYGDLAPAMQKRRGLSGHWIGKSITRTGLAGHKVRQHFLQTPAGEAVTDAILGSAEGAYLLHFLDQGFDPWRSKLSWRLSSRGFRPEIKVLLEEALHSEDPEGELRRIYESLFVFDPAKLAKLARAGASFSVDLSKNDIFARHFPAGVVLRSAT
jgi:hypothetical protein